MLEIAICDDEKKLRLELRKIIEMDLDLCGISCRISEFDCGERLCTQFNDTDFDIVFLDIEMGEMNGMDTARAIRLENHPAVIIFVTSYPDFVFEGYDVQAYNYILKPFQPKKLLTILHGAMELLNTNTSQYYLIEQKSGTTRLLLNETKYFVSQRREVTAVTEKENVTFYQKLSDLETELPDYFIRIHNRYLVNLNYINELEPNSVLCDGESLPVSRSCKQEVSVAFARTLLR